MSLGELNATIVHRHDIADGLWIIKVRPDDGSVFEFTPGQYAELGLNVLGGGGRSVAVDEDGNPVLALARRQYSIASCPKNGNELEFYIVLVPDGKLTPKLLELKVNDKLWLGPKVKGKFTMEEVPEGKHLVMISTGTGLAPFVSMLREYRGQGRWDKFVIIHGARYARDLGYSEELLTIAEQDSSVFYIPTVTREPSDSNWAGPRGRVPAVLRDGTYEKIVGSSLNPEDCQVFMCGHPDMITSITEDLEARGFTKHSRRKPGNIHFERYW